MGLSLMPRNEAVRKILRSRHLLRTRLVASINLTEATGYSENFKDTFLANTTEDSGWDIGV